MKILCTQENITKAIGSLERVTGKQSSLPILANFLLETSKGRLKISATNLEIGVIAHIGAKIEREGKIVVPAKLLSSFIHNLPEGDVVSLETENQTLHIVSGNYDMKIKGFESKDFPIIPQFEEEYLFSLPAQSLKNALSRLLPCVSLSDTRIELTGVHIFFFEKELHLAATDSFRLGEEIFSLQDLPEKEKYDVFREKTESLILPATTLQEVARDIFPETERVEIMVSENQIFFQIGDIQIVSRLINGKYPDYKQIIPQNFTFNVEIERELLLRAIRIGSMFSSQSSGEVSFRVIPNDEMVVVKAVSREIGENTVKIPAKIEGNGEITLTFNPRYILDGLSVTHSSKVLFSCNTPQSPASLRMVDEKGSVISDFLYIMMPVRK